MKSHDKYRINFPISCGICSAPVIKIVEPSPVLSGPSGLDLQVVMLGEQPWPEQVHRCPGCGVCASWVDQVESNLGEFIRSALYRRVADDPRGNATYRDLMAASLVAEESGDPHRAGEHALAATWQTDRDDMPAETRSEVGILARNRFLELWTAVCGDALHQDLPRTPETAAASLTGEVLLDNQLVVEMTRRLADWDTAEAALRMAQRAMTASQVEAIRYGITDDEYLQIGQGTSMMLELEAQLIRDRDASFVHVQVDLPVWFAEG